MEEIQQLLDDIDISLNILSDDDRNGILKYHEKDIAKIMKILENIEESTNSCDVDGNKYDTLFEQQKSDTNFQKTMLPYYHFYMSTQSQI